MDVLRNLFGNLSSGLIRLAVTVGILAAVYFFIVKPILDTTNNAINSTNDTINRSIDLSAQQVRQGLRRANVNDTRTVRIPGEARVSIRRAEKLLHCIQRASGDVQRMNRCQRRFTP